MDVRVVSDAGVEERPAEELAALLDRKDGLLWVDIPSCDAGAERVLPGGLFELILPIWLLAKGFTSPATVEDRVR
jgi:hypothetical protein